MGDDEEIPGVKSVKIFSNLCKDDSLWHGFTYKSNGIVGYCYKFKGLEGIHACEDSSSGTIPENLTGACAGSVEDIIDQSTTESVKECAQFCHATFGCNAYTWDNASTPFSRSCFLYKECLEQLPCYGCSTGRINCIIAPQCYEHRILDEESRNIMNYDEYPYGIDHGYCDEGTYYSYTSPKWKGNGYYWFLEPAGQELAEESPGLGYCGTLITGYLHGQHPTQLFEEVDMEACFDNNGTIHLVMPRPILLWQTVMDFLSTILWLHPAVD